MKKILSLICLLIVLPVFLITADEVLSGERIPDGHFIHIKDGKFMDVPEDNGYPTTSREKVGEMFDEIKENEDTVVVHFHGGLVKVDHAFKNPMKKNMYDVYDKNAYPIFFVWRSGFGDTLDRMDGYKKLEKRILDAIKKMLTDRKKTQRLARIINEFLMSVKQKRFLGFLWRIWQENLLDDYNEVYRRWPDNKKDQLKQAIKDGISNAGAELTRIRTDYQRNFPYLRQRIEETALRSERIRDKELKNLVKDYRKNRALMIFYLLLERTIEGRHHGLIASIQEEIWNSIDEDAEGFIKEGWKKMKGITADAFQNDGTAEENTYGGTAFLKELDDLVEEKSNIKVILVGHSAGAVYICNLLEHSKEQRIVGGEYVYPSLADSRFKYDVIFEAPACTFERFSNTIDVAGDKIRDFRMFDLHDYLEIKDKLLFNAIYSNSLLYFVSSVGESSGNHGDSAYEHHDKPILGMERYFLKRKFKYGNKYPEVANIKEFLGYCDEASEIKTAFSKDIERSGWKITAKKHGQCDDNKMLLESLEYIIEYGF